MSWSGVFILLAQIAGFTVVTWVLASRVIPPLIMLRYVPKASWSTTRVGGIVRRNPSLAWLDEPVEDVLQRMAERWLTVMPVMDRGSGKFMGAITSQEILDLIVAEARGEP